MLVKLARRTAVARTLYAGNTRLSPHTFSLSVSFSSSKQDEQDFKRKLAALAQREAKLQEREEALQQKVAEERARKVFVRKQQKSVIDDPNDIGVRWNKGQAGAGSEVEPGSDEELEPYWRYVLIHCSSHV